MNLILSNISKSFGSKVVLKDFSYTFTSPGLYVVTGESGIGKTTLLRLIAGLDVDFDGTITNGGAKNVSYMFQEYRLFPKLNALKNITVIQDEPTEDFKSVAEELLLSVRFPKEALEKTPNELSGGMKQRIALVRAVMKNSPILLLDEPTKELDEETLAQVMRIIRNESKKRIVIVVTHDSVAKHWNDFEHINL